MSWIWAYTLASLQLPPSCRNLGQCGFLFKIYRPPCCPRALATASRIVETISPAILANSRGLSTIRG